MFDASGTCVEIPSLGPEATIPPRAAVRAAAAVTERYGLVWVSPEAPLFDLPEYPEWDDPSFVNAMNEPRETTVSAGQLVDNFLDATHLRTVHAGTFGVDDGGYLPPSEIVRAGLEGAHHVRRAVQELRRPARRDAASTRSSSRSGCTRRSPARRPPSCGCSTR